MVSWRRPRAGGFLLSAPRAACGAWRRGPPPMRPECPRGSAPREPGRVQPVSPDGWLVPRIFVFEATRSCKRLGFGTSRWGWGHCPRHDMTLSFLMSCHPVSTAGGPGHQTPLRPCASPRPQRAEGPAPAAPRTEKGACARREMRSRPCNRRGLWAETSSLPADPSSPALGQCSYS